LQHTIGHQPWQLQLLQSQVQLATSGLYVQLCMCRVSFLGCVLLLLVMLAGNGTLLLGEQVQLAVHAILPR
jgi:hypothetical protein